MGLCDTSAIRLPRCPGPVSILRHVQHSASSPLGGVVTLESVFVICLRVVALACGGNVSNRHMSHDIGTSTVALRLIGSLYIARSRALLVSLLGAPSGYSVYAAHAAGSLTKKQQVRVAHGKLTQVMRTIMSHCRRLGSRLI